MTLKYYSMLQKGIKAFYYLHYRQASTFKKKIQIKKPYSSSSDTLARRDTVSLPQMTKPFISAVPMKMSSQGDLRCGWTRGQKNQGKGQSICMWAGHPGLSLPAAL